MVGLGSIGKRHLNNLWTLGHTNLVIVSSKHLLKEPFAHLPVYSTIDLALSHHKFDAAVLCTPTAYHIDGVLQLLLNNIPKIYVEKPFSNSLEGLIEVLALVDTYPNKIVVGFDLHFDPGLQKVQQLLTDGTIGNLVSVNAQVGQYLPDWRPAEDYRKGMSASRQAGGGVMLDLMHEFDYLLWLCGSVNRVACFYSNTGSLQIETEDVAEVLLQFQNGAVGTIHLDYLQQQLVRNCLFTGSHGSITWNLANSTVTWIDAGKNVQQFSYEGYERNNRFIDILKAFLDNEHDPRLTTLNQGIESLLLVLAAKASSDTGVFVHPASLSSF